MKNELMDRKQSCLPEGEEQVSDAIPAKAQGMKEKRLHENAEPQGEPEAEKHSRTIPPFPYQRPPGMSYDALQIVLQPQWRLCSLWYT